MIDAAIFAGLATHYQTHTYDVRGGGTLPVFACGVNSIPPDRRTTIAHPRHVNCLRCRRTKVYREARDYPHDPPTPGTAEAVHFPDRIDLPLSNA